MRKMNDIGTNSNARTLYQGETWRRIKQGQALQFESENRWSEARFAWAELFADAKAEAAAT